MAENPTNTEARSEQQQNERREFLKRCGRFAVTTPPAMAALLAVAEMPKEAHASTIGRGHEFD
jgi:hypothetical protein